MTRPPLAAALLVIFVLPHMACGLLRLGDASRNVDLHNATGVVIVLYENATAPKGFVSMLEPSATSESAWLFPIEPSDRRTRLVKATDRDGKLLYCHAFSFAELERIAWRIEITKQDPASCP
jgi:hypothetical protein